ncbi:MAG: HAE1 family hydrophobic/amphiphilic exporter-1 [Glaciecola sp.]|jgi:HAE1 family hydrophobic/amphiphilic exporter-1
MIIFSKTGQSVPLVSVATIEEYRDYARIGHVNHQRVMNIFGNIDSAKANTSEVLNDTKKRLFPELQQRYPDLSISLKGEVESSAETNSSIFASFFLALTGVFLLLSLQFKNYRESLVVILNIPLALIGAIIGHYIMGLDFTMPSMIGFVSLAGVVVNDSILLVEFFKYRVKEGMVLHDAAIQAVHDRFRAIFLTSITTIAIRNQFTGTSIDSIGNQYRLRYVDFNNVSAVSAVSATCGLWDYGRYWIYRVNQ